MKKVSDKTRRRMVRKLVANGLCESRAEFRVALELGEIDGDRHLIPHDVAEASRTDPHAIDRYFEAEIARRRANAK